MKIVGIKKWNSLSVPVNLGIDNLVPVFFRLVQYFLKQGTAFASKYLFQPFGIRWLEFGLCKQTRSIKYQYRNCKKPQCSSPCDGKLRQNYCFFTNSM